MGDGRHVISNYTHLKADLLMVVRKKLHWMTRVTLASRSNTPGPVVIELFAGTLILFSTNPSVARKVLQSGSDPLSRESTYMYRRGANELEYYPYVSVPGGCFFAGSVNIS